MKSQTVEARNLKAGMVVVTEDGRKRTLVSDAQPTARGYVRAETAGEHYGELGQPVNVHGSTPICIE